MTFSKPTAPVLTAIVFALLAATRIPLAPKYLYYFDSVNFALSLEDFDPRKHQPQPPGYPMFVALLRLLHLFVPGAQDVMVAAGIVVATAGAMFLWRLAREMFGPDAAILALAAFLFTPPAWFGGITNQVRTSLALCSAAIALLAWRALQQPASATRLYLLFAALGVGAGFRPDMAMLVTPLVVWVWWQTGRSFRRLGIGCLVTVAAAIPWMIATAISVGGLAPWFTLMWTYARDQFRGSSIAFGAPATPAWKMAGRAIAWNGLAAIAWIWAVPFVWRRVGDAELRERTLFLSVWTVPILLFSAVIHIGDPDQALGSIPAICVIGGAVLAAFLRKIGSRRVLVTALGVAAVNAFVFFHPPARVARASGYWAVHAIEHRTEEVFDAVRSLKASGPAAIVEYRSVVTWRHLSYYFPDDQVVALAEDPSGISWTVQHRKTVNLMQPADRLPGPRRVILVTHEEAPGAMAAKGWLAQGPVYYRDLEPGGKIDVGPYQLLQP